MLRRINEMIEKYELQNENARLNYHSKQWKYHIRRLGIYNDILSDLEELKNLREEVLKEAGYLLHLYGPKQCLNWKKDIGDCGECNACRVFKCIDNIEKLQNGEGII